MRKLVESCYKEVVEEVSNSVLEDRPARVSEIIRDWKCCAAEEWEHLSVEDADREFDRLYAEIEYEHRHEAMIYA